MLDQRAGNAGAVTMSKFSPQEAGTTEKSKTQVLVGKAPILLSALFDRFMTNKLLGFNAPLESMLT